MSGHDPMTSYFAVSCCYFETTGENSAQLETYILGFVAVGHVLINCIYNIINSFLASIFVTAIICVRRCIQSFFSMWFIFLWHRHLRYCVMRSTIFPGILKKHALVGGHPPITFTSFPRWILYLPVRV